MAFIKYPENYAEKYNDDNAVYDVLAYVMRMNQDGSVVIKVGNLAFCTKQSIIQQFSLCQCVYGKNNGKRLHHWIIVFSDKEAADHEVLDLVANFLIKEFSNYQSVAAIHMDSGHRHIHFVFNSVSVKSGRKFSCDVAYIKNLEASINKIIREFYNK